MRGRAGARARGFRYRDYGSMATVGKSRAVVEIGRLHFGGLLAWFAWMALHITVLIGFRNRLAVLSSWIYSYVFFRRGSRLITRATAASEQARALMATPVHPPRQAPIFNADAGSDHAARLLWRVPLQPPRAGAGVEHQQTADTRACRLHTCRGHSAGRASPTSVR